MVKCSNEKCPIKDKCLRQTAKDKPLHQTYQFFSFSEIRNSKGHVGYVCQFQKFV